MSEQTPAAKATPDAAKPEVTTPEQLHDAAIAATEAWQASPSDVTKKAATDAVAKAKEALKSSKKVVPEKYDLKLPDGSKLSATHLDKIASYAKERGLSQEDAVAALARDNDLVSEHIKANTEAQDAEYKKTVDSWIPLAKEDKEIGGDKFDKSVEGAKRVVDKVGSDSFKKFLDETGFGNHPEVIRTFSRLYALIGEDKFVQGKEKSTTVPLTTAQKFYGKPESQSSEKE